MKISYNWLSRYINPIPTPEETSAILTATGLEVESLDVFESHKGGLKGLIVGEVMSCVQHPNADRLKLTKVNIGKEDLLAIVCGAPNVETGQKVVVATIGTTLFPLTGESFIIKESKIRGELSQGMLCAEDEMGLGESHAGLLILPTELAAGSSVADYFGVKNDFVFEIGLTPNRSDAASHFGVARDLAAALYKQPIQLNLPQLKSQNLITSGTPIKVEIFEKEAVIRYSGISLQGIIVKESPEWLKIALKAIGLRSVNSIVDVTNFVLHELGQPLHAFDSDKISGNTIQVKTCDEGTSFTTLDGTERKLGRNDLMICDAEKPMCIAGVYGGLDSGVSSSTTNIFLESATFHPVWVRKTSKAHNLKTDSSFRFERGTDPEITEYALKRAADLIIEISGGELVEGGMDYYPNPVEWIEIDYSWHKMDRLIGEAIPREEAKAILLRLGIQIKSETKEGILLRIPPFKVDVKGEADITEEILRVYGYNNIAIPSQVRNSVKPLEKPDVWRLKNHLSDNLCSVGFYEVLNNSLSSGSLQKFSKESAGMVEILNPLSSSLNAMRQSLIPGMCETIAWNRNRQQSDLLLFEWGKIYSKLENGFVEQEILCLAVSGKSGSENWHNKQGESDYFVLKGAVERIFSLLGIEIQSIQIVPVENSAFSQIIEFRKKKHVLASLGLIDDALLKEYGIDAPVWVAECNWNNLLNQYKNFHIEYSEVPKFPAVRRDLALLLDDSVKFDQIVQIAKLTEHKLLSEINLFDVYQGNKLPPGKKSYAVSFTFVDPESTLTDHQIEKSMSRLIAAFQKELLAELR
jgi:phenylalanyl-tRNA synthetase beta chain